MGKPNFSAELPEATLRLIEQLKPLFNSNKTQIVSRAIEELYRKEFGMNGQPRNITESWLQNWLGTNRPDLGLFEASGIKGFYKLTAGPAHSFMGIGKTWKQVAAYLGAIEVPDTHD